MTLPKQPNIELHLFEALPKVTRDQVTHFRGLPKAYPIRAEDTAYRLGGDEFLVLLKFFESEKNRCRERTLKTIARILNEIRMPMRFGGQEFVINMSTGVCIIPPSECISDNIIKYADLAMYHAKKSASSDVVFYEDL